ncbi:MAG TPA: hypothetical protein VH835_13905 [Dongiaceae bacterium]|jgi:hypothetical protein
MHRFAAPGLAAVFLLVQICCAPPLRAAAREAEEPMHCPMQKDECGASETRDCEAAPDLLSDTPAKKSVEPVAFQAIAVAVDHPVAHAESGIVGGWWSAPTRTIQLRI